MAPRRGRVVETAWSLVARLPGSSDLSGPGTWTGRGGSWSLVLLSAPGVLADVRLPAIFGDHMVLQQNQKDRVRGWAEPDEEITVSIERQSRSRRAGRDSRWLVELDPMTAGGPQTLTVKAKNVVSFEDVMAGEV